MKFYRDFVDEFSDELVKQLNTGYESLRKEEDTIRVLERNEYYNTKQLGTLYQKLENCNILLSKIAAYKDKTFLHEAIKTTQNNSVAISGCFHGSCDWDCLYYSTASPDQNSCCPQNKSCPDCGFGDWSFDECCREYCNCEWDVINKILFLLAIKNLPISHMVLFDMLKCRTNILQKVYNTYMN